jgi:methylmalonyl-CoA mutase N-terminal domain/subunit
MRLSRRLLSTAVPLPPRWVERAAKELKGKSVDILTKNTAEGIAVKPLYTSADLPAASELEEASIPGEYPFTRGCARVSSSMHHVLGHAFAPVPRFVTTSARS